MEQERKLKFITVAALSLAVIGLAIGFAAFNANLTITSSTATVNSSSWEVIFENLGTAALIGAADEVDGQGPTINGENTTITAFQVTLTNPGDSITYTVDVANNGTFNAEVSAINIPTPTCEGTGANAVTDAENVCGNLTYTLTYDNDSAIQLSDALASEATVSLKLTLLYTVEEGSEDELPLEPVTVTLPAITLSYAQAE